MKKLSLRTFIQNLYSLWVYDYHAHDLHLQREMAWLRMEQKWNLIQQNIQQYSGDLADSEELNFVKSVQTPKMVFFPYKSIKYVKEIDIQCDARLNMPYVAHEGKRLYYPAGYSSDTCESAYRFLIEQDQILGGGYLEKAPHCYQTDSFRVEDGDVLIDGGAAEGLFALDNIEKVSHVYLIEADKKWIPALRSTFSPYKHKVTIISKYLSDKDDDQNVSLSSILSKHNSSCFVKMDVEGAEPSVIKGALNYLSSRENVKFSCCTYHYQNDAKELAGLFDEIGYYHELSDGWFFFAEYDMPEAPFLRKALIRAGK